MLKNRNILQIVRMIVGCVATILSSYGYAGITHSPVELKCSSNPMAAPWLMLKGTIGIQYTLTTKGLREDGKESITEVAKIDNIGKTSNGLSVYIEARCIPLNEEVDISLTDSFLTCNVGDGLIVRMFEPNNINPDKYHYVGILTITRNEKKVLESTNSNSTIVGNNEQQLQFNNKLNFRIDS